MSLTAEERQAVVLFRIEKAERAYQQAKGVVELEFPRDRNDFMAAREFIYLQNVRTVQKPEQKDMRIWL